eukprot:TRINITY_DN4431_c0_g2_i2.p1 TRINITY_DN4431_c0_g2~~TRINITY_DN4431_c0_g2_i2.p1  ORF type:complete len:1244 (-),score=364.29 TRINITY_DN4431_c0_g2_i2:7-3738(-)
MSSSTPDMENELPSEIDVTVETKVKKKKQKTPQISIFQLFRYADWKDGLILSFAILGAVANGVAWPLFGIIFGEFLNSLNVSTPEQIREQVNDTVVWILILAGGSFVAALLQNFLWALSAERQARRIRESYLQAIYRQEIGWFDSVGTGELTSRISGDTIMIQEGIEKTGTVIQFSCLFITGFVIGFVEGWKLALVLTALTPLTMAAGYFAVSVMTSYSNQGQSAYARAGNVATEVISGIRTVASFGAESREAKRYKRNLTEAMQILIKKSALSGFGMGLMNFVITLMFAIGLGYGAKLVIDDEYDGGQVFTVLISVIFGGFALGQAGPSLDAVNKARGAAHVIYQTIARVPLINSQSDEGKKLKAVKGEISLKNVMFCYPTRPDTKILDGINLTIRPGQTTALVGPSGCGKSSIIALVQRFYDPLDGAVCLDDENLTELNVEWLRSQIGVVGQEPVLFTGTIAENIRFGKPDATEAEVHQAAKAANAHNFIMQFESQYRTQVGEKGAQLSGGQKQRIAIARAIIKNPTILLLDEATSALDNESEKVVQEALDSVMKGRTTIVVAHRLSTIRHADHIAVLHQGKISEEGTHDELIEKAGLYSKLVNLQLGTADKSGKKKSKKSKTKAEKKQNEEISPEKIIEGKEGEEIADPDAKPVSFARLFALNKPEAGYMFAGAVASAFNGAAMPVSSLIFSELINLYYQPPDQIRRDAGKWAGIYIAIGCGPLVGCVLQNLFFGITAEKFIRRIRFNTFKAILRQDIAFFDSPKNSTGLLTARLASQATLVGQLVGTSFSLAVQNIITLTAGLVIAFIYCWELTLVIIAVLPVMVFGEGIQSILMKGFTAQIQLAYSHANEIATESIANMRTVASFTQEKYYHHKYSSSLDKPLRVGTRRALGTGLAAAFGFLFSNAAYGLLFWYGGKIIAEGKYDFMDVLVALMAIMLSTVGIGQTAAFFPNATKAKSAASVIFKIIDRDSPINPEVKAGSTATIKGNIEFKNVKFRYPERPDTRVFENLSFSVPAGKVIALVGQSGSGKSSVIALLERFYDPITGKILIDGIPLQEYRLDHLRRHISLVGQEPVLFSGSVAENIAYGKPGATQDEIEAAAKAANAHNFIEGFPEKYNTQVGEKGTQLSGGQKQRIAIARAIIKNPAILLLDEATSALDTESEKIVQDALDSVMKGRTTVIVAHRLSTISKADFIAVIKRGMITEIGTHQELLAKEGEYYRLVHGKKKSRRGKKSEGI